MELSTTTFLKTERFAEHEGDGPWNGGWGTFRYAPALRTVRIVFGGTAGGHSQHGALNYHRTTTFFAPCADDLVLALLLKDFCDAVDECPNTGRSPLGNGHPEQKEGARRHYATWQTRMCDRQPHVELDTRIPD